MRVLEQLAHQSAGFHHGRREEIRLQPPYCLLSAADILLRTGHMKFQPAECSGVSGLLIHGRKVRPISLGYRLLPMGTSLVEQMGTLT